MWRSIPFRDDNVGLRYGFDVNIEISLPAFAFVFPAIRIRGPCESIGVEKRVGIVVDV